MQTKIRRLLSSLAGDELGRARYTISLQVLMFLAVGLAGALAYAALATFFSRAGLSAALASIAAYSCVIPFAYIAQRRLTFRSAVPNSKAFPKYVGSQIIGLLAAAILSHLVQSSSGGSEFVRFAAVALVVAVTNYALLKFWTFRSLP